MKKTLVFGASLKESRYSNMAVKRLMEHNIKTEAFGLKAGKIRGLTITTKLQDFRNIHTITMYIPAKHQEEYYDYLLKLNPKRVIFNPGTENVDFIKLLKNNNIEVEIACTLVLLATNQY